MTFTRAISINNYGPAKFIVDGTTTSSGTHSTISSALTSASSGDTIFIRPGTYTENLTLKAGVNLTAFGSDASINGTGKVIISGTCTLTAAGSVTIYGIQLQTNAAFFLAVTGSAASIVNVENCYLNISNNTGISYTSSSSSSAINIFNCNGKIGTTGIAIFSHSSAGEMKLQKTEILNPGASTTASTCSAGNITLFDAHIYSPITTSATASYNSEYTFIDCSSINATCLTHGGSADSNIYHSTFNSGTASCVSIATTISLGMYFCNFISSNTNVITGLGTLKYAALVFNSTSSNVNTSFQTQFNEGPSKTIGSSNSGATNQMILTNSSNTASSTANFISTVGGSSAGDAIYQAIVSGVTTWTWGVDNSASDAWALAASTALGTTNVMSVATSGEINYPLQCAFFAINSVQDANQTGDGTTYTVICDSEIFDQNSDYNNTTGTFTAPVTGRYQLSYQIAVSGMALTMNEYSADLVMSNRTIRSGNATSSTLNLTFDRIPCSFLVDMDAGDIANIRITVAGATKVADIDATDTVFGGMLVC